MDNELDKFVKNAKEDDAREGLKFALCVKCEKSYTTKITSQDFETIISLRKWSPASLAVLHALKKSMNKPVDLDTPYLRNEKEKVDRHLGRLSEFKLPFVMRKGYTIRGNFVQLIKILD